MRFRTEKKSKKGRERDTRSGGWGRQDISEEKRKKSEQLKLCRYGGRVEVVYRFEREECLFFD